MTQLRPNLARLLNDRLDWNLLRTFLVIMQERSISRAAARLHLTQPAVSHALKRLEATLGRSLIVRRGPHFAPTSIGEEVYRVASEIYGQMSRLDVALEDHNEDVTGAVRLLAMSRVDSGVYDDFLSDFHRSYPRIDLHIEVMRSSDIISSLLQQTATVGLGVCRSPVEKLETRVFLRHRYAIFCGRHHRLFGRGSLVMDDLLAEDFVAFTSDQIGDTMSPLTVFRDQSGFTGRIVATSSNLEEVRRLICLDYGIGCLPEHIVREDLAQQRLWRLPPADGVADVDISLMWLRGRKMNMAEQAFLDGMERTMQTHALHERLPAR